jgi:glutamyl-tRNA reductase
MTEMARLLTNKLLHEPSVQLKQMTAQGRIEALALAQELFALGDSAPGNRNTTVQGDS